MPQPKLASVPQVTPRYSDVLEKALAHAKALYANHEEFIPHSTTPNGTKISMKSLPGSALPITRGEKKFPSTFSQDDILACLRHVEARQVWDARFEDMEVIEMYGPGSREAGLVHSKQKGQWPVISGRDFIVAYRIYRDATDNSVWFIQTSVEDDRLPHVKGRVRGHVTVAAWIIMPTTSNDGDGWDVTYITQVDPAGTLPAALVKMVSSETPACAGTVLEYLEKKGVPKEE
ncbi:hypothetical protein HDU67_007699 [Dinochytrium kinnereticum]|nr:hypothetical protein HDU67_007699 [Dinochytrium kinnereticum]